uniref:Uncharacterized protein n=1 Tax=Arundo donax TaxID=35708 RepID=A0A0A9HUH6_ARUDO
MTTHSVPVCRSFYCVVWRQDCLFLLSMQAVDNVILVSHM